MFARLVALGQVGFEAFRVGCFGRIQSLGRAIDDQFTARDGHIDPHNVRFALVMVAMRRFDDDSAARNAIEKRVKLCRFFADIFLNGVRTRHIAESDLQGNLHTRSSSLDLMT